MAGIVDWFELRFGRDWLGSLICGYGDVEEREEKMKVGSRSSMVAGWWRCAAAELFVEGERERERSGEGFGVEREMAKCLRGSVFFG